MWGGEARDIFIPSRRGECFARDGAQGRRVVFKKREESVCGCHWGRERERERHEGTMGEKGYEESAGYAGKRGIHGKARESAGYAGYVGFAGKGERRG